MLTTTPFCLLNRPEYTNKSLPHITGIVGALQTGRMSGKFARMDGWMDGSSLVCLNLLYLDQIEHDFPDPCAFYRINRQNSNDRNTAVGRGEESSAVVTVIDNIMQSARRHLYKCYSWLEPDAARPRSISSLQTSFELCVLTIP